MGNRLVEAFERIESSNMNCTGDSKDAENYGLKALLKVGEVNQMDNYQAIRNELKQTILEELALLENRENHLQVHEIVYLFRSFRKLSTEEIEEFKEVCDKLEELILEDLRLLRSDKNRLKPQEFAFLLDELLNAKRFFC